MKKAPQGSKNKGPSVSPLKTKPFCDCKSCECVECPDILDLLGITVTEKSCDFGSKVGKGKSGEKKKATEKITVTPSLLGVLNDDRDCACEIMARAVRSHTHANLGAPARPPPRRSAAPPDPTRPSPEPE